MTVPERSAKKRIRQLENELADLRNEVRLLRESSSSYAAPREEWLGRVIGTPAATDNTFEVELLSCRFTASAGKQDLLMRQRDSRVIAQAYPARSYRAGDYVRVERRRGQLARDTEAGEWWICAGPAEIRWGRTVSASASYPDLSVPGQATRGLPVYEVELGHLPFAFPTPIGIGWTGLNAAGQVNPAYTSFVADDPRVVVYAASLLGDVHQGQPVLMALEAGQWFIIGPVWATGSREQIRFSPNGYSNNSPVLPVTGIIDGETMSLRIDSIFGTGGLGSVASSGRFYDIEPNTNQTNYDHHFATVRRRGDYLLVLSWNPRPWQYGYMESVALDSNERQNMLGATLETTTVSGHSHFVDVANQEPCFWEIECRLASNVGNRFSDFAKLQYDDVYGPWRNSVWIASFQQGEQIRLTVSTTLNATVPASAIRRGVQMQEQPQLLMWRLPEGLSWIP